MGLYAGIEAFEVKEVKVEEAEWQLVVETEAGVNAIYLRKGADVEFWKRECLLHFGVWPNVFQRGNFVEFRRRDDFP